MKYTNETAVQYSKNDGFKVTIPAILAHHIGLERYDRVRWVLMPHGLQLIPVKKQEEFIQECAALLGKKHSQNDIYASAIKKEEQ